MTGTMNCLRLIIGAVLTMAAVTPASAGDDGCGGCLDLGVERQERPLHIEIESGLRFSRLALLGKADGEAAIDAQTGEKRVYNMVDLGGMSYQGRARVTGEPFRPVRIELPARVPLRSPNGAEAELTNFVTDLPETVMLDENGVVTFNFGARISSKGASGGNFRGRINIRVDYF